MLIARWEIMLREFESDQKYFVKKMKKSWKWISNHNILNALQLSNVHIVGKDFLRAFYKLILRFFDSSDQWRNIV